MSHGSDICECGDFRSQHNGRNGACCMADCNRFRFVHQSTEDDLAIWNKYHASRESGETPDKGEGL